MGNIYLRMTKMNYTENYYLKNWDELYLKYLRYSRYY